MFGVERQDKGGSAWAWPIGPSGQCVQAGALGGGCGEAEGLL